MNNEEIRKQLIQIKEKYGMSVTWIAEKSGVERSGLSRFLSGYKSFGEENRLKLERFLNEYRIHE